MNPSSIVSPMKTLNFFNPIIYTNSQFPPSIFFFHFPSLSRQNGKFIHTFRTKSLYLLKPARFSLTGASSSSNSVNYGGWDDVQLGDDLVSPGESTQLRDFLVSKGIDDKKHVFMFLLGIFCAFAICRVRVSTIIVFPASVLIFAVGFSLGFFRSGSFSELSVNASKKKGKEEISKVYSEKLRSLVSFFEGFDVKVNDLKNDIQRAIDTKEIELGDLENYANVIESIQSSAFNCRNAVEATVDGFGNSSNVVSENQKSSDRKKKEIREVGFELLQFVGGLFGEKLVDSKPNKMKDKDNVKQGFMQGSANDQIQGNSKDLANNQTQENSSDRAVEEGILDAVDNEKRKRSSRSYQDMINKSALDWDSERRIRMISEDNKVNSGEKGFTGRRFIDGQEYSYQSSRLRFVDNHQVSWKMKQKHESETWKSHENLRDSMDFNFHFKHIKRETSFINEQMLKQSSEAYRSLYSQKINEGETYRSQFQAEELYDDSSLTDHQSVLGNDVHTSSSSMVSDDVAFDRYLKESNNLLKQAKEYIRGKDEELAEIILYKSAKLLSKAIAMKPVSLLAVGLLGNTYLLHGELKLKISRGLRTLLSRGDRLSIESQRSMYKEPDERVTNKEKIVSSLVNACEECEEFLIEAGRKYRLALSIDGNDVRALYNWGLALSFRAQLIADIGPEAAFDADKVFLAAIDKFDAMMSKGNEYAPDALFRWGMVLQQRSRLRPRNSKEKAKLLMQAKRLYEDALDMDCGNIQVREALSSCVAEINHRLL